MRAAVHAADLALRDFNVVQHTPISGGTLAFAVVVGHQVRIVWLGDCRDTAQTMPIWISQDTVTANTARNHSRTAWLTPLQARIHAAVRAYVQDNPGGDKVTLAIFDAIPPADVQKLLPKGRTIDAGRRELGLRIPLELITMYGAHRVETFRRDDGRTASPRRTGRDWPRNFTPHRVVDVPLTPRQVHAVALDPGLEDHVLWQSVLTSWLTVLADYRAATDDLGWRHTASANTDLLRGALWRQPDALIHEPPGQREATVMRLTIGGVSRDLVVKIVWPTAPQEAGKALQQQLDHADWQLRDAPSGCAMCIVVPALSGAGRSVEEAESVMSAAVEAVAGPIGVARFLAWDDPLALTASGGSTYPGVMLVVRPVISSSG